MTISSIWVTTSDYFSGITSHGIASKIFFKLIKIPNKHSNCYYFENRGNKAKELCLEK